MARPKCPKCGSKKVSVVPGRIYVMTSALKAHHIIAVSAATPKSQVACDKAGMNWDATATAPSAKCSSAFA